MEDKIRFLTQASNSLELVVKLQQIIRNALENFRGDSDFMRFSEKAEICLVKLQELRAEILELIEEMEGAS